MEMRATASYDDALAERDLWECSFAEVLMARKKSRGRKKAGAAKRVRKVATAAKKPVKKTAAAGRRAASNARKVTATAREVGRALLIGAETADMVLDQVQPSKGRRRKKVRA